MIEDDAELAEILARAAGNILLEIRNSGLLAGKALGQAGDRTANQFLIEALAQQRPDDGLLSEESVDTPHRLAKSRVWIIDPLDGTREYAEGRDDWAVHVGLAIDGEPLVGAVALPAHGEVFASHAPHPLPAKGNPLRLVVSRSRPAAEAVICAEQLGATLVPMGSAGAKAMAVVQGLADIYLHSGGQYAWDNCAPAAVALAYGLHVSRIDGTPLIYNLAETYMPDLLICRKEDADRILALIATQNLPATSPN